MLLSSPRPPLLLEHDSSPPSTSYSHSPQPSARRTSVPSLRQRPPQGQRPGLTPPAATHRDVDDEGRFRSLPHISYSVRKQDVTGAEAARLLLAASTSSSSCLAAPDNQMADHFFAYWREPLSTQQAAKMSLALNHSIAVAAAYANVDIYQHSPAEGGDGQLAGGGSRWTLQLPSLLPKSQHTLVGLARAYGDSTLTATLTDLAVHPRVQGFGIGSHLVHLLVRQLHSRGIYDIGAASPPELAPFFLRCSFDKDPLQSTLMVYGAARPQPPATGQAGYHEEARHAGRRGGDAGVSGRLLGLPGEFGSIDSGLREEEVHPVGGLRWMDSGCAGDGSLQLLLQLKLDEALGAQHAAGAAQGEGTRGSGEGEGERYKAQGSKLKDSTTSLFPWNYDI